MILDEYSLKQSRKKAIGGLATSYINGVFYHTNTIEQYNGQTDFNEVVQKESQLLLDEDNLSSAATNRFVIASFGDLKNYNFFYK